jgi:hypothetical protein
MTKATYPIVDGRDLSSKYMLRESLSTLEKFFYVEGKGKYCEMRPYSTVKITKSLKITEIWYFTTKFQAQRRNYEPAQVNN